MFNINKISCFKTNSCFYQRKKKIKSNENLEITIQIYTK